MSDLPAVVLLGITVGLQSALLAVGLVLIYRASRFINFAQAQMGAVAASVLAVLVFDFDLPYPLALVVALVAGGLTGAGIERLLGWRLFDKSRLTLLVATIGVAQLVLMSTIIGPLALDQGRLATEGYPQPFTLSWRVGSFVLNSSQVTTLVVAPLIAVGLMMFLTNTKTGKAIRAAASNPDAARLSGVSVRKVSLLVWVLASTVSSLAAILYAPSQPSLGFAAGASIGLLLRGLAAALLAGMGDFRIAFAAGVALGVVEQCVLFYTDVTGLADLSVVLALVVGLVIRARVLERDLRGDEGLTVEEPAVPIPDRIRNLLVVKYVGIIGWVVLLGLVAMAPLFWGLRSQERAVFLLFMLSFAIVGLGLTVLLGWAGQVSLGQFAVLGVGAFAAAYVHRWELGLPLTMLSAGLVAALVSVLVGAVAVRFEGLFLGVVTLGFAFAARSWLFRQSWVTTSDTDIVYLRDPHLFRIQIQTARTAYAVGVVVLVLIVLSLHLLRRSSVGRALLAVRDNPGAAAAYGMNPTAVKLLALSISGFITGLGGVLWGMGQQTWNFSAFDPSMSFVMLSIVVVGGLGTLHGPILGTIAVFAWPYLVPDANTPAIRALTSGLLLLITLLFFPGGLAAVLTKAKDRVLNLLDRTMPEVDFAPVAGSRPLEVTDVSIAFGGIHALDGVSLHVEEGEILGLIGGNGAGKSTLLNCISGHVRPNAGEIVVAGQDIRDLSPEYRPFLGLSRTFQDARLFPGLTVRETVMLAMDRNNRSGSIGAMVGAPWVRWSERAKAVRAQQILESFGLADRGHSRVGELSTGMRRICDLATVVASEPTIVLLDEPTAGLAQREVEAFAPLLRRLRDDYGCSMVVVEHDMPMLMALCDRIYCLEAGRVIAEGTPDEVRSDELVIASYMGADLRAIERSGRASDSAPAGTNGRRRPRRKPVTARAAGAES
ncbi:MAG TPA: branched-chain amino acid ABC transporter permease/ATP-binding protein [Acidimicrobiales bacterium]|jgi:ABC-type branched-subunit amino acid transport system ATPase component/ABC-type branched-subunit amino acid transport system permease subunit